MTDFSNILNTILAVIGTIIVAIAKSFHIRLRDVESLHSKMHEIYVKRDDFKEMIDRVFRSLERIETKLDEKADKQ